MEIVEKATKRQKINNNFKGMYDTSKRSYITDHTEDDRNTASFRIDSYKDVKNYIHNYLGLTKEEVMSVIKETLDETIREEIQKILNDKEGLRRKIEESIVKEIRRQDNSERHSWPVSIMDDIYNKIDKTIHEEVRRRLIIELRDDTDETV